MKNITLKKLQFVALVSVASVIGAQEIQAAEIQCPQPHEFKLEYDKATNETHISGNVLIKDKQSVTLKSPFGYPGRILAPDELKVLRAYVTQETTLTCSDAYKNSMEEEFKIRGRLTGEKKCAVPQSAPAAGYVIFQ